MIKIYKTFSLVAALAVSLTIPLSGVAQEAAEPPAWLQIRTVNLHADGVTQWTDLQKELVAAERDEDQHRQVWEVLYGNMNSFHIVSAHQNLAGFDAAQPGEGPPSEEIAKWIAAITPTVESRTLRLSRLHADLSIPEEEGATRNLAVLRHHHVKAGQHQAFQSWVENELKPALAKGGVTGLYFSRTAFGGDNSVWTSLNTAANWAELDQPGPLAGLDEDERAALLAPYSDMVSKFERHVLRYREDLSY